MSEKAGLKLNIRKPKMMASNPISSWQINGKKVETVTDFIFLGSKITADSDSSYEIKTFAPWKKSYDKPRQHMKKRRHCFTNKGPYSQSEEEMSTSSSSLAWRVPWTEEHGGLQPMGSQRVAQD